MRAVLVLVTITKGLAQDNVQGRIDELTQVPGGSFAQTRELRYTAQRYKHTVTAPRPPDMYRSTHTHTHTHTESCTRRNTLTKTNTRHTHYTRFTDVLHL